MKNRKIIALVIICSCFFSSVVYSNIKIPEEQEIEEDISEDNTKGQYKTLDQLLRELREERKIIEQRRLEEIKMKRLQEELSKSEKKAEDDIVDYQKIEKEEVKEKEVKVPKLIVRLRGKHSLKYLCEYDFTIKDDYGESKISKCIVSDYSTLINNVSLKVRADEYINFEFDEKPKELKVYYAETGENLKINRNSILVPDLEERVVLIVEGIYENGYIKYAILLDIRRP